ncbi:hypothetical protein [Streptomyces sp. NPDC048606]|uniref:hypothetical protein n=1 Tax=Streptomyces sp. NPDC048606 TaxID=3154726 RepID=UPI003444FD63
MDERWVGRRVYGAYPDDPDPWAEEGELYVELTGGPLDGELLQVTGWTREELAGGVALICETSAWGPGGRAEYEPADPAATVIDRYVWVGDSP